MSKMKSSCIVINSITSTDSRIKQTNTVNYMSLSGEIKQSDWFTDVEVIILLIHQIKVKECDRIKMYNSWSGLVGITQLTHPNNCTFCKLHL